MFFYTLATGSIDSADMGFGIVAPPANPKVVNGLARVDLDQNVTARFSRLADNRGNQVPRVDERAYQGEPRWSGHYYLDYASQPTCP